MSGLDALRAPGDPRGVGGAGIPATGTEVKTGSGLTGTSETDEINGSFGAGAGVQLLGIKIPGLDSKKTLGVPSDKVITEPPNVNCQV
jgi:hypothetical protein